LFFASYRTKTNKYYGKNNQKAESQVVLSQAQFPDPPAEEGASWKLKTREEYAATLPANQRANDLQVQNTNRYFKRKKLEDIVLLHGHVSNKPQGQSTAANPEVTIAQNWFIHFLKGMLDPDPWNRWTSQQALSHPFLSDKPMQIQQRTNTGLSLDELVWSPPWDPTICQRKLRTVEKTRDIYKARRQASITRKNANQPSVVSPGRRASNREPIKSPECST
jgi:serine/threonine protein kinase